MAHTFVYNTFLVGQWGISADWIVTPSSSTPLTPGATDTVDFTSAEAYAIVSGGGEAAIVNVSNTQLSLAGAYQFGTLTLGNSNVSAPTRLQFETGAAASVEVGTTGGAASGEVTVDAGSTLLANGYAEIVPDIDNKGTIEATQGLLTLDSSTTNSGTIAAAGGSITISGAFTNTGTIDASSGTITINSMLSAAGPMDIGSAGTLVLNDVAGAQGGLNFAFTGSGGALQLSSEDTNPVIVVGLAGGDTIRVGAVLGSATYAGEIDVVSPANHQEVNETGTLTVGTQQFTLDAAQGGLEFETQVVGGKTLISAVTQSDSYTWTGATGITGSLYWSDIANWTDTTTHGANVTAPGATNSVTFDAAGTTSVAGGGAANALNVTHQLTLTAGRLGLTEVGAYTANSLSVGAAGSPDVNSLTLVAATLAVSGNATATDGSIDAVNNSGITIAGTLSLTGDGASNPTLSATISSKIQVGGGMTVDSSNAQATPTLSVDSTSSIEIGTLGGAAAGAITIDAGKTLAFAGAGTSADLSGKVVNNGTIDINNGTTTIAGALSGSGAEDIGARSTLYLNGTGAAGDTIALNSGSILEIGDTAANKPDSVASTVSGFTLANGSQIQLDNTTVTSDVYKAGSGNTGTLKLYDGTTLVETLTLTGNYSADSFAFTPSGGNTSVSVEAAVCYVRGTLIRTTRGEVAIEGLQRGDKVVTASGERRPVVWLGHRTVDCRTQANPREAWPIRVSAHAFGDNLPDRDLYLSPGHSVRIGCIDEALVPIGHLVNGASIARHPVDEVEYWHVELDRHAVILAHNLPAESYLDMDNRDFFIDRGLREYKAAEPVLPVLHGGPMVELARHQLRGRAEKLGWTHDKHPEPRLWVDGVEQRPAILEEGLVQFELPTSATDVRLVSNTFVPADLNGGVGDPRVLGLSLSRIGFVSARGSVVIALDDERLRNPYPVEREAGRAWRWTDGSLALSPALWAPFEASRVMLHIDFDRGAIRGYAAPDSHGSADATELLRVVG